MNDKELKFSKDDKLKFTKVEIIPDFGKFTIMLDDSKFLEVKVKEEKYEKFEKMLDDILFDENNCVDLESMLDMIINLQVYIPSLFHRMFKKNQMEMFLICNAVNTLLIEYCEAMLKDLLKKDNISCGKLDPRVFTNETRH